MNLAEWHEVLATEAATPDQVGAVIGEWRRLGLDDPADRARRLVLTARLLGLAEVSSTHDLVMGDAGRLLRLLRHAEGRADLEALLPDPAAGVADAAAVPRCTWADVMAEAGRAVAMIERGLFDH